MRAIEAAPPERDPEISKVLDDALDALRHAVSENGKLLAVRDFAEQLHPFGDDATDARDLLSESAINVHGLGAGIVQEMLEQGVDRARLRRTMRINGSTSPRPSSATQQGKEQPSNSLPETGVVLKSTRASKFKLSAIQWLWPDRFALGKLGLLAGLPDEGKGQILADMAARVTRGDEWPCDEGQAPQGNVILLSAEDNAEDTVVPRLLAAGADLDRVEIVHMVRADDKDRMFSLVTDLPLLRQKITQVGNVKLVQIDPVSAYLGVGKVDSFRTTDVRAVLAPLVDLAAELKVAVIGIMHFNKKIDVTNALLRISDSLAFGATARHVYAVVDDPENNRKLLIRGKNNLANREVKALAYNFGTREVGKDIDTKQAISAPHIIWHSKHVDVTASEAMQATKAPAARDDAKKFLADLLASGPVPKTEIEDAAEGNGIAERTLFRAKAALGVIAKKTPGKNGAWTWHMPNQHKSWNDE